MKKDPPMLSKSRFLAGLQCPLRLWYQCYNRELATPVSPTQQALFDAGHAVGRLATRRYPNGVLIAEDHRQHEAALRSTRRAMDDAKVGAIFEAAFLQDGVRIRADILERRSSGRWNLVEVKSSTGVKDEYLTDVAVQYRVLQRAGIDLEQVLLMHIDRDYVLEGQGLDLDRFLVVQDLSQEAVGLQAFVAENLERLNNLLCLASAPQVQPSRRCHQPHTCEFWEHCTRNAPLNWIFELPNLRLERFEELAARGIASIEQIPDHFALTALQRRVRDCVIEKREYIGPDLNQALSAVSFPLHFLDFETIMPAIPRYGGTRPFQVIPFEWSDHILFADGRLEHKDFLCDADTDPRPDFVASLLDALGEDGTIWIFSAYEQTVLRALAEDFPHYGVRLDALHARFVDLCAVIKNQYYHPAFQGSFSLKKVLPALVPAMDYQNLAIQDGGLASLAYVRMIDSRTLPEEKQKIRQDLLAYCGQDTLAMVRIRERLLEKSRSAAQ